MTNAQTFASDYERHREVRKRLGQINKTAIFAALAAAAINFVFVTFDGESDSGQIEDLTAIRKGEFVPLPDIKVKLLQAAWGKTEPDRASDNLGLT